jgi:hypothetical protein
VILDTMLQRAPWHQDTDAILQANADGHIACPVTTHSLATAFYVSRRAIGTSAARSAMRKYLASFEVLTIDKQVMLDADTMPGADFEDNILIAAAVASALDAIITRNVADFSHSRITVWEPAGLRRQLQLLPLRKDP